MQLSNLANGTLQQWPLTLLERRGVEETQRFFQQQPCDTQFSHELLRRALLHKDERAWTIFYREFMHAKAQRPQSFCFGFPLRPLCACIGVYSAHSINSVNSV